LGQQDNGQVAGQSLSVATTGSSLPICVAVDLPEKDWRRAQGAAKNETKDFR